MPGQSQMEPGRRPRASLNPFRAFSALLLRASLVFRFAMGREVPAGANRGGRPTGDSDFNPTTRYRVE